MTKTLAVRAARARRQALRRKLAAAGEWHPFVDADIVRDHIDKLRGQGVSGDRLCELASISRRVLTHILHGTNGYPPARKTRTDIAERILAVKPNWDGIPDGAFMPPTAAVRRLQALVAIGWPAPVLAGELGVQLTCLNRLLRGAAPRITGRTDRSVAALYRRLWNVEPLSQDVNGFAKKRAQARAQSHGWSLPAAWDDDTIHDPNAQPDYGQPIPRFIALAEDCLELERQEFTREQIAARLGVTRDGLQRALSLYRKSAADHATAA